MNIHFPQVQRKSQLISYLLAIFTTFTMLMLTLSLSHQAEIRISIPPVSIQAAQFADNDAPAAIRASLPPTETTQAISTPEPVGNVSLPPVPQAIHAPAPSVP
jgi:hypothetical protein